MGALLPGNMLATQTNLVDWLLTLMKNEGMKTKARNNLIFESILTQKLFLQEACRSIDVHSFSDVN